MLLHDCKFTLNNMGMPVSEDWKILIFLINDRFTLCGMFTINN